MTNIIHTNSMTEYCKGRACFRRTFPEGGKFSVPNPALQTGKEINGARLPGGINTQ